MNWLKHWATIFLGLAVAAILFITVFSFQVEENQTAILNTMGKVEVVKPGKFLNFRWPYPFQDLTKYDHRLRTFSGKTGKIEETPTSDGQNIVVGIFINYRISDALKFYLSSLGGGAKAELDLVDTWMRSAKLTTFGHYPFNAIVNAGKGPDGKTVLTLYPKIYEEIKKEINDKAEPYGIKVEYVGINVLNVPSEISKDVFARMIADRNKEAQKSLSEGSRQASAIKTEANKDRDMEIAKAEAAARETRAKGDAEAAQYYAIFKENPELAAFLRKLDALEQILKSRTTLIVDDSMTPFDAMRGIPGMKEQGK